MEINDALVTAITRELLKRLGGGESLSSAGKKPLVLAGDSSKFQALANLEGCYDIIRHGSLEAAFPGNAEVLVAALSIQALVRITEGDAGCTPEGAALLWALLRGKKPVVLEEGIEWRAFKDAMAPALAAKYLVCERTLAAYGVLFVPAARVIEALAGCEGPCKVGSGASGGSVNAAPVFGAPSSRPSAVGKTQGKGRRVISETEVIKLCPVAAGDGQILEIGARDILTPLAVDYVSRMRITVNRAE